MKQFKLMNYPVAMASGSLVRAYQDAANIDREGVQVLCRTQQDRVQILVRGTNELDDWWRNLSCDLVQEAPWPGYVHRGFCDGVKLVWGDIKAYLTVRKGMPVQVGGHSQGGALAEMLLPKLVMEGRTPEVVVTYGAPRIGNPDYAEVMGVASQGILHRVVRAGDPVPLVPFAHWGYRHTPSIVHYFDEYGNHHPRYSLWQLWKRTLSLTARHIGKRGLAGKEYHDRHAYLRDVFRETPT